MTVATVSLILEGMGSVISRVSPSAIRTQRKIGTVKVSRQLEEAGRQATRRTALHGVQFDQSRGAHLRRHEHDPCTIKG
jgi:hypothetical protein